MSPLAGKQALVCGASKGIGREVAFELARLGCRVAALARSKDALQSLISALPGSGHQAICADVSDRTALKASVEGFIEISGPCHILINNTGGPPSGPITEAKESAFQAALEQHLFVNVLLTELLLPGMKKEAFGRIINIISTSVKAPLPGLGVSNTVRAAVASWAKTLATEIAPFGVTVNGILPGATATGRLSEIIATRAKKSGKSVEDVTAAMAAEIPMKRFGKPEEVAALAGFLATPAASYITGTFIPVDGGRTPNI